MRQQLTSTGHHITAKTVSTKCLASADSTSLKLPAHICYTSLGGAFWQWLHNKKASRRRDAFLMLECKGLRLNLTYSKTQHCVLFALDLFSSNISGLYVIISLPKVILVYLNSLSQQNTPSVQTVKTHNHGTLESMCINHSQLL